MSPPALALVPELERRVETAEAAGRCPLAVLDVDLTLVDNATRNRAIWRDWLHSIRHRWPEAEEAMVRAQTMRIVFGVMENMNTLGVRDEALLKDGLRFWLRAFFSDEYCRLDTPLPGAVDAVAALRDRGVTVAYVTARTASMVPGTVDSMGSMGFPMGVPGTVLCTKPSADISDDDHKRGAFQWLRGLGTAVLCADNEPVHVNAMAEMFPEAISVLVETRCSPNPPELLPGALRRGCLLEATCQPP